MKRLLIALFATVAILGVAAQDAEAARLGGGRSFGMNRSSPAMKQTAPAPAAPAQSALPAKPAATPATPPAPQPSGMSRWLGPIAGIAAGIGLAALLSHFGLGEGVASMLMILLAVMAVIFVVRLLFRRAQPQPGYAGAGAPAPVEPARFEAAAPTVGGGVAPAPAVPAGFDTEGFLRQAKLNFIRLQAANDNGNLEDLKQFTAPEVFAEVQMQYEERGRAKQQTDVMQLDASLIEVESDDQRHVASVHFHGQIREDANAAPTSFDEVWHLTKPVNGNTGWVVAGIQQLQ